MRSSWVECHSYGLKQALLKSDLMKNQDTSYCLLFMSIGVDVFFSFE